MKSIFKNYKLKSEFPKLTKVELVEDDLGYYLKEISTQCVLEIAFKNPSEARQHALNESLVFVSYE